MAATTITSAKGWGPDLQAFAPTEAIPDALINQITTLGTVRKTVGGLARHAGEAR